MSVGLNVYIKTKKEDKVYYFKAVYKLYENDGNVEVRPIIEETYLKNSLKRSRKKEFKEYEYDFAPEYIKQIVDKIENTGKVQRWY